MNSVLITPGQALHLWHHVCAHLVSDELRDLTQRQTAILLEVYLTPPPHTVRGLAATLKVTKPVITRALNTLGGMGLVTRRRDEHDRRNVLIQRTVDGSNYVEQLGELLSTKALEL